jgi:predicted ABC-class ATPase
LLLRLLVRLPLAGMCCDGKALRRFLTRIERFAQELGRSARRPDLRAHRLAVARQQALRSALTKHGLVAFIGDGARLARAGDGGPLSSCRPWRTPRAARMTIDLGDLGRVHGLGLRHGVTAVAGAPYHGKSTLLAAIAAGRDDHPPGDGRELVVADASTLVVQAEDGRRIKQCDLSGFFAQLPGADSACFSTTRASGATSMGASLVQGVAGGCRLLLIDEDTAASNFLTIDPVMRRLLGRAYDGTTTLLELLPALAASGVSSVLVAGSNSLSLAASDRVLLMEHYQPQDVTTRVARLLGRRQRRVSAWILPQRVLHDQPDCLFGPRHFLTVDANEPERPVVNGVALDLRRCGWELDRALVRGALAAAAWCCRLADNQPLDLLALKTRYHDFITRQGVRGLDPFDTALITLPPWQLVVTVLERLERPKLRSR